MGPGAPRVRPRRRHRGIFVWWPYGAIGALVAIAAVVRMFRGTEDGVARLPRRQKLTTAVLPAVQRKSSEPSS